MADDNDGYNNNDDVASVADGVGLMIDCNGKVHQQSSTTEQSSSTVLHKFSHIKISAVVKVQCRGNDS